MSVEIDGTETILQALKKIQGNIPDLLSGLGTLIEEQTKRRIREEKTAPDGTEWKEWSIPYRATRNSGQSLLINEGNLLESIQHQLSGTGTLLVGTNLVYANKQQSDREYLGLSSDNLDEIERELTDWAKRLF